MNTLVAIYKIQNVIDGRMYIGQTVNPQQRKKRHFWKNNGCVKLRNAIQHHGRDNFVFSILCWCENKAAANEAEELLIELANTRVDGYNITPGGYGTGAGADNPFFGQRHSAELKKRLAEARRGQVMPIEVRRKIAEANRKRVITEATKEKLRARPKSEVCSLRTAEANRRRVWTDEAKAKLVAFNTGRKMSDEAKAKIAAANRVRVWSAESRAKLSASKTKVSA
jgi:group I intron endonuclease